MEVTASKVVVLLMLGTIKMVFGFAPLVLTRVFHQKKKSNGYLVKKFIGSVLCIGGGVLLSTVFIHMLGEVRVSMGRAKEIGLLPREVDYPFAELLFCVGFLLILLIESLVHKLCGGHCDTHALSQGEKEENPLADSPKEMTLKIPQVTGTHNSFHNPTYLKEFPCSEEKEAIKPNSGASLCFSNKKVEVGSTGSLYKLTSNTYNLATDSLAIKLSKTPSKSKQARDSNKLMSSVRGLLVVVALSVHSLFEGMAVGLEDTPGGVWQLFLAISVHSIAVVFCIGTELVSSGLGQIRIILSMLILSLVTPLGVLVGMLVTHEEAESGGQVLLVGVLQGLAGGTLLYITFFEVLNREKLAKYSMSGMVGALIILLSFTCMAALNSLGGHSHAGAGHVHGDAHNPHQVEYFLNVKNSDYGLGHHHSHGGGDDHDHAHNIGQEMEQYKPEDQEIIQQTESHAVMSSTPDHEYSQYDDKPDDHVNHAYDNHVHHDQHEDHAHVFDYDTLH